MYKSYFRYGWRNLINGKAYSLINVTGLAIGLACGLGIGLFIHDEFSFDKFHAKLPRLYRVVEKQKQAGVLYDVACTPGPLGPAMKTDFAEVQQSCRLGRTNGILETGQKHVEPADIRLVDNSFFSMFDFKLLKGNPAQALRRPDEIVLTRSVASQLLGPDWPTKPNLLGTTISMTSYGVDYTLTLTGIVDDPPVNSHIRYDVLLSMLTVEKYDYFKWDNNSYYTYVLLNPSADPVAFDHKLRNYIDRYSEIGSKDEARTLFLQPMKDIYLHSHFDFNSDDARTSDIAYVRIFFAVALMVLLIAIFNFVNLSTARATHRAKEVGVRKVIGAMYKQLVAQFLVESFLLTALAVVVALALLQLFLPLLNEISGKSLYVPFEKIDFLVAVALATVMISLLAGLYPAFFLSSFSPAKVLKGFLKVRSGITFRRALVVGQFMFAVMLVIGSIVIYKQLRFIQDKQLGFDREQLLYMRLKNKLNGKALTFKNELENQPGIVAVAPATSDMVDVTNSTWSIGWEGQPADDKFLITQINTDADFLRTMGMTLAAGRNFVPGASDTTAYLLNETAARRMGWTAEQALGKAVTLWGKEGTVVGVVKDFHFRPMTAVIEPFIFRYWAKSSYAGVFVRTQPGHTREALATVAKIYKTHEDQAALQYQFIGEALDAQYRTQQNSGTIILFFSVLAVIVSCLGLFGLATYAAEQRTKEIGIRKVLGATMANIVQLLSSDFIKLVVVAIALATPIAWWSTDRWLQDFAYKIDLEWWMFAAAGAVTVLVALATVSYHSIKAAIMNPVKSLRTE
ncbi:MacB-like core domain-containing protein [Chryseolinea serpens]|uniref:MacB-like core domain-containing protein n=1 Tax=Chryseolinea serpens TaxID=947013 RepID=A0A1M5RFA5_9BACT|nr:ABC transporter permease [Chryseolinea serpens]SHH24951.1 MacB-like core domain-containing protein [Chryseolinea serpens]